MREREIISYLDHVGVAFVCPLVDTVDFTGSYKSWKRGAEKERKREREREREGEREKERERERERETEREKEGRHQYSKGIPSDATQPN